MISMNVFSLRRQRIRRPVRKITTLRNLLDPILGSSDKNSKKSGKDGVKESIDASSASSTIVPERQREEQKNTLESQFNVQETGAQQEQTKSPEKNEHDLLTIGQNHHNIMNSADKGTMSETEPEGAVTVTSKHINPNTSTIDRLLETYGEHLTTTDRNLLLNHQQSSSVAPTEADSSSKSETSASANAKITSPPVQAKKPMLWTSFIDPMSQMAYYRNNDTLELQWENPLKPDEDPWDQAAKDRKERWKKVDSKTIQSNSPGYLHSIASFSTDSILCLAIGGSFASIVSIEMFGNWMVDAEFLHWINMCKNMNLSSNEIINRALFVPGLPLFMTTTALASVGTYCFRDLMWDNNTRSIGKYLWNLEIVDSTEHTLPNRAQNAVRNLTLPLIYVPCGFLYVSELFSDYQGIYTVLPLLLLSGELASFIRYGHGVGDWISRTRVIKVDKSTREDRLKQKEKLDEL
eukprot:g2484.t1